MKRSKPATVASGDPGASLPPGWSCLHVPPFTFNSMAYGAAGLSSAMGPRTESTAQASSQEDDTGDLRVTGDDAYEELLDVLASPHGKALPLVKSNPWIYGILTAMTFNAFFVSQSVVKRRELVANMEFAFELMIGWIVRLYNGKCWVLPIVVLSLWFWRCEAPQGIWDVCSRTRLLYTKKTTENIAFDLGKKVQEVRSFPTEASRKVILCVFDNCLIPFRTSFEGSRGSGDGSWHYLFINWFSVPLQAMDVPLDFDPSSTSMTAANTPRLITVVTFLLPTPAFILRCVHSRCHKWSNGSMAC